jgi:predicted lysophospholipase L1 biosynthesis ABC-type transport system permease subunit
MIFALGFACGLIVGVMLAWLCLTWLHPIDTEETGTFLFPMSKGSK